MGTTTFSGPLKAGTIKDTTGTTVGTNVANVGYGVLAQSAVLDIAGATTTTTIGHVPANSQVISVVLSVTTANDDGTASTVAIGTAADADAFLAATSVQSTGTTFSGVMTSASADVGTFRCSHYCYIYSNCWGRYGGCCSCYSDVCPKQQSVVRR
jgi:hypothetical protein